MLHIWSLYGRRNFLLVCLPGTVSRPLASATWPPPKLFSGACWGYMCLHGTRASRTSGGFACDARYKSTLWILTLSVIAIKLRKKTLWCSRPLYSPNSTWLVSRHDSTRSTCRASRDERVESVLSRATWRTTNELYSARLYKFSRFIHKSYLFRQPK